MSLGERISAQRKSKGMSQEKLAALVGVSRQAVTKWETGQSAPSTENLWKLADVLGTTLDLLTAPEKREDSKPASVAESLLEMEKKREDQRRAKWRQNRRAALGVLAGYLLLYLLGRIGSGRGEDSSVTGWLFALDVSKLPYLYGWLLKQNLFWLSMLLSVLPALWGKYRFSYTTFVAFVLGLLLGEWLGVHPAGAPYGHGHYGWAIWGGIFLYSILLGIIAEKIAGRGQPLTPKKLWIWYIAAAAGVILILLLTLGSLPTAYGS